METKQSLKGNFATPLRKINNFDKRLMLRNLLLGYAFYDMAVWVQAFLTNATNLSKIQMQTRVWPVFVQKCMICRPLQESLSSLMNSFWSVSESF